MKDLIKELCSLPGVSGEENEVAQFASSYLSKFCKTNIDKNGNVIAQFGNMDSKNHIMLDAHLDQIGFIVTYIDDNGFIRVSACGGIDRRIMQGSAIKIYGKKIVDAVVSSIPVHVMSESNDKLPQVNEFIIDTGLNKKDVESLISLGDRALFYSKTKMLLNNRVSALALDNRAGVAALIRSVEILAKEKLDCKVTILLSAQEEVGELGAQTGAFLVDPDECIVVDVSFAGQPSVLKEESGELSKGPMIGCAASLDNKMSKKLIEISEKEKIPYQLEIMGGTTGTNADKISLTKEGIPCAILSISQRNMHTTAEIVDIDDIENTAKLISKYVMNRGV